MGLRMLNTWIRWLSVIFLVTSTHAQQLDNAIDPPPIVYKIQTGDTLTQLSKKYLRQPADLEAIRALNYLRSIDLLPTGELLKIPRQAAKQSPSQATVMSLSCAHMIRTGTPPKPLVVGSLLNEGAIIDIPAECHASLLLEDSSIIRLPSSAAIRLSVLRKNALETAPEVRLDLVRGRIELEVYKGRAQTTPFEVRTPLSVTGVRGTEFRVGYTSADQTGQLEVIGGIVKAMGVNDSQSNEITKGQGVPFDKSGKALPVEKLLNAPIFERAEVIQRTQGAYAIKLISRPQAHHYVVTGSKSANLLGERTSQILQTPEVITSKLSQEAAFYQVAAVSHTGLVGATREYGFCAVPSDTKSNRCKAVFETPLAEGAAITFALIRHVSGSTQELVSTKELQAHNGRFTLEGLPAGHYSWSMSYVTTQTIANASTDEPSRSKQSGSFDLIALTTTLP